MRTTVRLALLLAVTLCGLARAAEPQYDGKGLRQWLVLLASPDRGEGDNASYAVEQIQAKDWRAIVMALDDSDPRVRTGAARALQHPRLADATRAALRKHLTDPDLGVVAAVAKALALQGREDGLLPHIERALKAEAPAARVEALEAAEAYYERQTTPASLLLSLLDDPAPLVRREVLVRLAHAPPTPAVVAALRAHLADPDLQTRATAARITWLQTCDEAAYPVLLVVLTNATDDETRKEAIRGLASMGAAARGAVAPLMELAAGRGDWWVRSDAVGAAVALDPGEPGLVPLLMKMLDDEDGMVHEAAARGLAKVGDRAAPALPQLLKLLAGQQDTMAQEGAAEAVGNLGPAAHQALPLLAKLLPRDDGLLGSVALAAIIKIATPEEALPYLIQALARAETMADASDALGAMGAKALPAIPALLKATTGSGRKYTEGSSKALVALARIDPPGLPRYFAQVVKTDPESLSDLNFYRVGEVSDLKQLAPIVVGLIEQPPTPQARVRALQALVEFGPAAAVAVPVLARLLPQAKGDVAMYLHMVLQSLGPAAAPAVPRLVQLLRQPGEALDWQAARVLEAIGPAAKAAMPELLALARSKRAEGMARSSAVRALRAIGAEPETVLPLLSEMLTEDDTLTRAEAAEALIAYGPRARAAGPALRSLLRAKAVPERMAAARAVWAIAGDAGAAIPVLLDCAHSPEVALEALVAVANMGAAALPARAGLEQIAAGPDPLTAVGAAAVLGEVTGDPGAAMERVMGRLADLPCDVMETGNALMGLRPVFVALGPSLVDRLVAAIRDSGHPALRLNAITMVMILGKQAEAARPELAKLAGVGEGAIPQAARLALQMMNVDPEQLQMLLSFPHPD